MNARRQALGRCDALQQGDELIALAHVQRGEELGLVVARDPLELAQQLAPRSREVDRVRATVVGVSAPFGEVTLLKVVDQRDHRAAVNSQRATEGLLRSAFVGGEVAQHPEVTRSEIKNGQALGEGLMPVLA